MLNPKLSVITVVYNSENLIEKTIQSIINQTYSNIEYIIIDGASTDSTMEIVNHYSNKISKIISEPDNGLYYAMNKGLDVASGDYVLFINAGDMLCDTNIVSEIFFNQQATQADVIYGDTDIIDNKGKIIHERRHRPPEKLKFKSFKRGMLVCHQSFIAKKSLAPHYDTNFRYAADYDWCVKILKQSKKNYNANLTISFFLEGGQTRKTIIPGLKERFKSMKNNYGIMSAIFWNIILGIKFTWFVAIHRWF